MLVHITGATNARSIHRIIDLINSSGTMTVVLHTSRPDDTGTTLTISESEVYVDGEKHTRRMAVFLERELRRYEAPVFDYCPKDFYRDLYVPYYHGPRPVYIRRFRAVVRGVDCRARIARRVVHCRTDFRSRKRKRWLKSIRTV